MPRINTVDTVFNQKANRLLISHDFKMLVGRQQRYQAYMSANPTVSSEEIPCNQEKSQ